MKEIKKALEMINSEWSENWDIIIDTLGQETADQLDKAINELKKL